MMDNYQPYEPDFDKGDVLSLILSRETMGLTRQQYEGNFQTAKDLQKVWEGLPPGAIDLPPPHPNGNDTHFLTLIYRLHRLRYETNIAEALRSGFVEKAQKEVGLGGKNVDEELANCEGRFARA
ncbi:hypothetical protein JCM11251_006870 [Rhodosporidiobolus azoricus]